MIEIATHSQNPLGHEQGDPFKVNIVHYCDPDLEKRDSHLMFLIFHFSSGVFRCVGIYIVD